MTRERVLVVDDDAALLAVMEAHLKRQGYLVAAFTDGRPALEALGQDPAFAVLVTDLDMPAMHGQDLLRLARQRDPRLEVVVITGNGTLNAAVTAMRADGAYDFLVKPFETLNVLSLAVARAAAHRQLVLERAALTERLNALTLYTGDAILSADERGLLQVVNPAAARLLGRDDLTGRLAAESLPRSLTNLLANWQTLNLSEPLTVELAGPAQAQWVVSLAPIPSEGWVMIIRDVTVLKRLDDVRFQLLSEAAGKLQLPLAQAISNMAELNTLVGAKDPRAADILYRQTAVWDRIQHWLFDLLQLVRIESGLDLRPADVDLAAALPEIARGAPDRAMRDRRVSVALDLAPDLPRLRIDPNLLRQLVMGLVRWAGGRSPSDSGVRLRVTHQSGQLAFEVADTGPALGEADVARLFEKTLGVGGSGSGLELALVKSIADRMGGQVWARRQAEGGLVAVYLPAPSSAESASSQAAR
ncbi:MAG: response regulator [Anaerolineales bacterium]|nr:response regulator [Anaerolineales bacterium]